MHATSQTQRAAFRGRSLPPVEEVRAGVYAIPLAMPGTPLPFSLCYAIQDDSGDIHIIDTGMDDDENWDAFNRALAQIGGSLDAVTSLTITHVHRDHAGMAARLKAATNLTIRMHRNDVAAMRAGARHMAAGDLEAALVEWAVPERFHAKLRDFAALPVAAGDPFECDVELDRGETLPFGGELRVVHTPGHTPGHIALVDDSRRLVFTGDHVLPVLNPGVGLGGRHPHDDPIGDHHASLAALTALKDYEACPGHGFRFLGLPERCTEIGDRYRARAREVSAVLADQPDAPVWDIAGRLEWTGGWESILHGHLYSALAQTAMHVSRAQAELTGGGVH